MERSAVLLSGGIDRVVLAALELNDTREVWPIHVRTGLAWEEAEAEAIRRVVAGPHFVGRVQPVTTLHFDMRDVYPPSHWAVTGQARGYSEPDETVYVEGRNISPIAKAAVFRTGRGIARIALGPLAGNPFPDASPAFLEAISQAMSLGLARQLDVVAPLAHLHKQDVLRVGATPGCAIRMRVIVQRADQGRALRYVQQVP